MRNVLVTGATGFIGKHLVSVLLKNNIKVYIIARDKEKVKEIDFLNKCNIIICDMSDIENIKNYLNDESIDTCYHFAWEGVSGAGLEDYEVQSKNVTNTLLLLKVLKELKIKKFIGAGSIHEKEFLVELSKNSKLAPYNTYKCSKLYAHSLSKIYCDNNNIEFYWPIITNTYGKGEKSSRFIISTVNKLINNEMPKFTMADQLYDFVHVTDLARAFYAIGIKGLPNKEYIICNEEPRILRDYIEELGIIVNKDVKLKFGEVGFSGVYLEKETFNNKNLIEDTGFTFETSFSNGIKDMIGEKNG